MNKDKKKSIEFGDKIRNLRLEKNLNYEQIFDKTKISEIFINALERESFSELPAYAFSKGLLENLLELYKVDFQTSQNLLEEFIALYQKSSAPAPINSVADLKNEISTSVSQFISNDNEDTKLQVNKNEKNLLGDFHVIKKLPGDEDDPYSQENQLKEKIFTNIKGVIIVVVFILLGMLLIFFNDIKGLFSNKSDQNRDIYSNLEVVKNENQEVYSLYSRFSIFDLVKDDLVKVFFYDRIFTFHLTDINNTFDNKVVANFDFNNEKLIKVYLFEEVGVDIDQNGRDDLIIKFQKISGEVAIILFSLVNEEIKDVNYETIWNNQEKIAVSKKEKILLKEQNKSPIQAYIKATTLPVHLSYNIDGQRQNIVNLLPGNRIELIALDHLELQIGNFRSVNLILNFIPLNLEVENPNQFSVAKIIKWLPSYRNEAKYDLIIKDYIN